jgi:hypothetical protein
VVVVVRVLVVLMVISMVLILLVVVKMCVSLRYVILMFSTLNERHDQWQYLECY